MNGTKYIGLDFHHATISVAVLNPSGKLVMEAILKTKAETILQFIHGLRGSFARDVGRRNLCGVGARCAEAACATRVGV
jgi:hypothetical protein